MEDGDTRDRRRERLEESVAHALRVVGPPEYVGYEAAEESLTD